MKLKLDSRSLRFKITGDELQKLRAGEDLQEAINIAGNVLGLVIDPSGDAVALNYEEGAIRLMVSSALVKELEDKGRSKEGIKSDIDGLTVFLQVDARTMP